MTEEKIIIKIDKDGNLKVEVSGILGPACVDEVKKLLEDIAYIQDIIKTDEYYMSPHVVQRSKRKIKLKGEKV